MSIEVREITSDDDLRTARRIDLNAFGYSSDGTPASALAPWRRATTNYLATDDGRPVGTCRAHAFELTVPGGGTVGVSGIGDLGVLAGHTRRGVLGSMMARVLADGLRNGRVAAVLDASEATIYGRFGFGPATRSKKVRIQTSRAAMLPGLISSPGQLLLLEPAEWADWLKPAYQRACRRRPGEVARSDLLWDRALAPAEGESVEKRMCLAHVDADGACDAYALYTVAPEWAPEGPNHTLAVLELVAASPAAELSMWDAVLSLDLVRTVEAWIPADGVLFDSLADRWAVETVGDHDTLWVRLLDVTAALAARRYRVPGHMVLEVGAPSRSRPDPSSDPAGRYELSVAADGSVRVRTATADPDLELGVAELGSVWLGAGSLAGLGAVGRVRELRPGSLALADAMFGWSPSPNITQEF